MDRVRPRQGVPAHHRLGKGEPQSAHPGRGPQLRGCRRFAWLSVQSGLAYRLPTRTSGQYAARGGRARPSPWRRDPAVGMRIYDQTESYRGGSTAPYRGYPEAVNAYPPNGFGLYQMAGNVWELTKGCEDQACKTRVLRGGSFQSTPWELRVGNRFGVGTGKRRGDAGLRVARDLAVERRAG
ncbi:formylglycine-generating enzyme family protein [Sphingomonas sp. MMS24-JH45]